MRHRKPQLRPLLLALGAGAVPGLASALGLGGIEVKSALGQPFEAEIALLQDRPGEADLAQVGLASSEAFARAGLDRRFVLTGFEFTIARGPGGRPYVRVRSSQPIREPYLDFLVEAAWPGGNLLRQYTVLLDPPARPWASVVDPAAASAPPPVRASAGTAGPQRAARPAPPWPQVDPFAGTGAPAPGERYGPVRPGDTLWAIAARAKPAGVSQAQAMAAILRANPQAFIGGDATRLMAGSTLVIPSADQLQAADETSARAAMAPYVPGWRSAPEPAALAPASAPGTAEPPAPSAQGPVEDAAPSAQPKVRLVQAETPESEPGADAVGATGTQSDQSELLLLEESLDAARQENAALRERLEALEAQMAALSQSLGPGAGTPPGGAPVSAPDEVGPDAADPAAGIAGAAPARAETPGTAPQQEQAGERRWTLVAVAAGLVGGLGFLVARRRMRERPDPALSAPESAAAPSARTPPARARTAERPEDVAPKDVAPKDIAPRDIAEEIEVADVHAYDDLPGSDANASRLDLLAALVAARNTDAAREVYAEIAASGDAAARAQADALMGGARA